MGVVGLSGSGGCFSRNSSVRSFSSPAHLPVVGRADECGFQNKWFWSWVEWLVLPVHHLCLSELTVSPHICGGVLHIPFDLFILFLFNTSSAFMTMSMLEAMYASTLVPVEQARLLCSEPGFFFSWRKDCFKFVLGFAGWDIVTGMKLQGNSTSSYHCLWRCRITYQT